MPRVILLLLALLAFAAPARAEDRILTEADGTRTLIHEAWVPAAPASVWQSVSTARGWEGWAVAHAWLTGDTLETSYAAAARPGDPGNIQQRILAQLPGRLLVFRNVKTPPGFPHAAAFGRVTQFLELIPEDGGTRVRLTGTGYAAGDEGDALLGFFQKGNRYTLDLLAARFGTAPLDFLVGHCWRGTLPNGDRNDHCFERAEGAVRDRHQVFRADRQVYGGETIYAWDGAARQLRFTYTGMDGGVMKGSVRQDGQGLDFGTSDWVGTDGTRIALSTRWVRVASDSYEARDTSPNPHFNRTTRYTRVD
ncbi:SRPBCC domain-containing protein [Sphingomonas sp. LB-2]|uniref:SRPBCC family protein n=1 Tax=Sphingomonas caeni TaxID=2984949 RepID=UPI002231987E|nr:SRPBCC domain-containing protein [Sphingomonas caeni]MCW3847210.1 SRPBCC domain-containing protein [Sphingomonas caeni]